MSYGKQEIYDLLDEKGIRYTAVEHAPVYTMEDLHALNLPEEGNIAKNLFLRSGNKKNFYLIVAASETRINLKELGLKIGAKGLSFAPEHCLEEILGLYSGAVTPLGVLNDRECRVKVYLDRKFRRKTLAIHPNDNAASIWLSCDDLEDLIREHGNEVEYISL